MVSKSDNDRGLDGLGDRFSKVSNSGCGDVSGVWKSSIGVSVEVARLSKSCIVITLVLEGVEDGVKVVRLRKSWIGEEMSSDELDLMVLLKQQGLTLILVVLS